LLLKQPNTTKTNYNQVKGKKSGDKRGEGAGVKQYFLIAG